MQVVYEINTFEQLYSSCWGGAKDTLNTIIEACKEDYLVQLLEDIFYYNIIPNMSDVNDYLWFEREYIFKELNIK